MSLKMQPSLIILPEKFEKLRFTDFVSLDSSSTPSTPSTPYTPPTDPYEIEVITAEDKPDIVRFLQTFFFRDEPLNHNIQLVGESGSCPELEDYCVKELDNGLGVKAVSNGKLIGLSLNGIIERGYLEDVEEEMRSSDPKFDLILQLLKTVAIESAIFDQFKDVDKALTVKIISVDKAWRGRGIAVDLMNKTRELAREHGIEIMTSDCTSHFTARALKKLGFECIYAKKYADYKVDGEAVFTPEHPHAAVTVYAQRV